MELKTDTAGMLEVNDGCTEMFDVDDLETLFSYRLSAILVQLEAKVKGYWKTRKKLDERYATVEILDPKGAVIGKRAKDEEADEYKEKVQTLMEAGVSLKVGTLRMSEIIHMREVEGLPIKSSTIHKIRKITRMDVDLDDDGDAEPEKVEATDADPFEDGAKPEKPKRRSRAERVKEAATAAAN